MVCQGDIVVCLQRYAKVTLLCAYNAMPRRHCCVLTTLCQGVLAMLVKPINKTMHLCKTSSAGLFGTLFVIITVRGRSSRPTLLGSLHLINLENADVLFGCITHHRNQIRVMKIYWLVVIINLIKDFCCFMNLEGRYVLHYIKCKPFVDSAQ